MGKDRQIYFGKIPPSYQKLGKTKDIPEFREQIKIEKFKRQHIKFTANTFHEIRDLLILYHEIK